MPEGSDGQQNDPTSPIPDGPPTPDDAPAQSGVTVSPATDDDAEDAALDAAYDSIVQGRKAGTVATPAAATTPAKAESATAGAGTTPAAQPADDLDDDARQLLQRYKLKDSTYRKLDADERVEFLANLKERHDNGVRMYQENQQLQKRLQGATQPPATPAAPAANAAPPPADDPMARIDAMFAPFLDPGQQVSAPLKDAMASLVNPILERAQKAEAVLAQIQQAKLQADKAQGEADIEVGIKAIPKDVGVALDLRTTEGKANRVKLLSAAARFLAFAQQEPGWNPQTYGWQHAISDAFPTTFKAQNTLAQRNAQAQAARDAARRGVDPGGRPNRSKPAESEDDFLDKTYDDLKQGKLVGAGR